MRSFAAEIRPHHEAPIGFRVGGKIVNRFVELGAIVHRGERLAELDPIDLALDETSLASRLAEARSENDFQARELARYRELRAHDQISEAELDRHESTNREAHERVLSLEAQTQLARNAHGYATLRADRDGIISAVLADPGQVVVAGQGVVAIADSGVPEVHFDVPENLVLRTKPGDRIRVAIWPESQAAISATIRDVAQQADSATRTFRVKAVIQDNARPALGTSATAYVEFPSDTAVSIPSTSVEQPQVPRPSGAQVWAVDSSGHVQPISVELIGFLPHQRVAVRGLAPHTRIVTAGLRRLHPGDRVTLLDIPPTNPVASEAAIAATEAGLARVP